MPRLNPEQWEQARAEYEVRGTSLRDLAKKLGVAVSAVSQRAKKEGWIKGKSEHLVEQKVNAIKALADYGIKTEHLPYTFRHTLETVAQEKLQAEGLLAQAGVALASRIIEMADSINDVVDLELLTRAVKNLAPPATRQGTTVNVMQQQQIKADNPRDVLAELTRQATEYPNETSNA